ncbi:MAG TPA: hypothetical protein VIL78_07065 [Hanamia sp.]
MSLFEYDLHVLEWINIFSWAAMVAYSRINQVVHYPSDVAVPFLINIFSAYGMSFVYFNF